ncbi:MAG TPA: hypothetical protein VFU02_00150 [Polyangiaceae bacterium]|nr:hypothetical protein [Polyangiaceae bacterium]
MGVVIDGEPGATDRASAPLNAVPEFAVPPGRLAEALSPER